MHDFSIAAQEVDIIPPVVTGCPQSSSYQLPIGSTTLPITWVEPRATDNSGDTPSVDRSHRPGDTFPVGTTQVVYRFTDKAGNNAECTFTLTVGKCDSRIHPKWILCLCLVQSSSKLHFKMRGLSYIIKMQYVQISNITGTSIKHAISGQSTLVVKGCIDICLMW